MSKEITVKKSAVLAVSDWLQVDPEVLKKTLKATVFRVKDGDRMREASDEEFMSLMVIANTYKLNPIIKELYAFPQKGGGIVPIVSTDGWTRLMTTHKEYKCHLFRYAEKIVTMKGAKPCPEWCEIDIEKTNGSHVVIREYLDEVFRDLPYVNAWQTHTKRFLRHKTKIQGAREAFGFSGIYEEDEAERIIEITDKQAIPDLMPHSKIAPPEAVAKPVEVVAEPEPISQTEPPNPDSEAPAEADKTTERPLPPGFVVMVSKFNGICKSKVCAREIKMGTEIAFSKTKGAFHVECSE